MAVNSHRPMMTAVHSMDTTPPGGHVAASDGRRATMACGMDKRGRKGLFPTAACYAAPLVLVLALPVLGAGLGGRTAPVVSPLTCGNTLRHPQAMHTLLSASPDVAHAKIFGYS